MQTGLAASVGQQQAPGTSRLRICIPSRNTHTPNNRPDPSPPSCLRSGRHLGAGMANNSCVRTQRTGWRLHKWNFMEFVPSRMHAISGFLVRLYNGLTNYCPQGQKRKGTGIGGTTFCFSALSVTFSVYLDRAMPDRPRAGSWPGMGEQRGRKTVLIEFGNRRTGKNLRNGETNGAFVVLLLFFVISARMRRLVVVV